MSTIRVLVTGASGFVGRRLCELLEYKKYPVVRVVKRSLHNNKTTIHKMNTVYELDINKNTVWNNYLDNIDCIIHLAGRAHIINETEKDPLAAFRAVNTFGTECLARAAAEAGVKRFVYISSIGVNGNMTVSKPYNEQRNPLPHNDYAVSKWEAERLLFQISAETGMEVVIIRPPLVYGAEVKANFLRLLQIVDRAIPLPLATVQNARSLVGVDNLLDLLITCINHPSAAGEIFLVSDGKDLSTPDLIQKIARFMDRPHRLYPFPPSLLHLVGKLVGKEAMVDRLCNSLQVDIEKVKNVLGWEPSVSVDEGLKKTVEWFMEKKAGSTKQKREQQ